MKKLTANKSLAWRETTGNVTLLSKFQSSKRVPTPTPAHSPHNMASKSDNYISLSEKASKLGHSLVSRTQTQNGEFTSPKVYSQTLTVCTLSFHHGKCGKLPKHSHTLGRQCQWHTLGRQCQRRPNLTRLIAAVNTRSAVERGQVDADSLVRYRNRHSGHCWHVLWLPGGWGARQ
jgi:hypothetical protein